jgi:RNA polymerase sigma-70 factor (sigma-E family)
VTADEAVADLFDSMYPSLLGTARLLLDDKAQAEEVVQEAFVRVRLAWWRIRDPERAGGYLRTTVANLARTGLRRRALARVRDPQHARAALVTAPAAEDTAVVQDEHRLVVEALRGLPRRQRECLVLRYYLDLTEAETARALGITPGSVKTHVHRGLAALGLRLEGLA